MKLIALLIGLAGERLATHLFHLRELRWLDRLIDSGLDRVGRLAGAQALLPIALLIALLVAPVLLVRLSFGDALADVPYLILAVVVLFFSLGPKDIGEEVDEYCIALQSGDDEAFVRTARALVEAELPDDKAQSIHVVEEAVCVQANNRLFAVIFWFILLGPVGAWLFRVSDLIRRRAVFKFGRHAGEDEAPLHYKDAAEALHGWLAWLPARLSAAVYALAGNFDGARSAWPAPVSDTGATLRERSERLLARVGMGALNILDQPDEDTETRGVRGARAANGLVFRSFFIWAAVIAAMTLYGWSM